MKIILLVIVVLIILWFIGKVVGGQPQNSQQQRNKSELKVWQKDDGVSIYYKTLPPHFHNIQENAGEDKVLTCGFCKYYHKGDGDGFEKGCEKYGVICYGIGSIVKTKCDDFKLFLAEQDDNQ